MSSNPYPAGTLIVPDFETTGTDYDKHEAIMLALLAIEPVSLKFIDGMTVGIQPQRGPEACDPRAMATHGIKYEDALKFPHPAEVGPMVEGWIKRFHKPVMMGYWLPFDEVWLRMLCPRLAFHFDNRKIDVYHLVAALLWAPGLIPNAKLETACQYLGIEYDPHNASSDVVATVKVLRKIREGLKLDLATIPKGSL